MRPTTTAAVILGLCAVTEGATKADNGFDTLTEWSVPFTDANPFQIAMAGANVVYLRDNPEQRLGLLEVDRARFTEWPLPYLVTSPGDIKVRAGDGAVFVAGLSENEIGQFDLQTQSLRRWPLPLDIESGGPFSLGIDELGGVFFTAYNASGALIGRLDTTSATVTTWQLPAAIGDATRVTVAPGGLVFFNDNAEPFSLASLDVGTGAFTDWGLAAQPAFAIITDASGDVFFQEEENQAIARLIPSTGQLTEWTVPGLPNEDIAMAADRVFMGGTSLTGSATGMAALDPAEPGVDSLVTPFSAGTVLPASVAVTPTTATLTARRARGQVSTQLVRRRQLGAAFVAWSIPEQPRMLATGTNGVFFGSMSQVQPVIGRLTR